MAMGTIRKIGSDYYIEFDARGLKYQRKVGADQEEAVRLLAEIEGKIRVGEKSIEVPSVGVDAFFKDFLARIKKKEAPPTVSRYQAAAKHFQEFIHTELSPECQMPEITPSVLEKYRASLLKSRGTTGRPVKPGVINFTLYLLKDIFDHAINCGHINDNPTLHTRMMAIAHQNTPQTLSTKERQKLFDDSTEDTGDMIEVLLKTGIHIKEAVCLNWTNVDLAKNCLKIEVLVDAVRHGRLIPMDRDVRLIFQKLHDQKKEHQEYVFQEETGKKLSDNRKFNQTIVVNTFARDVLEKGVSLVGLHKLLGFRDIAQVMRYTGFVK